MSPKPSPMDPGAAAGAAQRSVGARWFMRRSSSPSRSRSSRTSSGRRYLACGAGLAPRTPISRTAPLSYGDYDHGALWFNSEPETRAGAAGGPGPAPRQQPHGVRFPRPSPSNGPRRGARASPASATPRTRPPGPPLAMIELDGARARDQHRRILRRSRHRAGRRHPARRQPGEPPSPQAALAGSASCSARRRSAPA